MTTITYTEDGFTIDGHAENSVVCHGISAIIQMVANYVEDNRWGVISRGDGHLGIKNIKKEYMGKDLFCAMMVGLEDIEREYPGNVKIVYEVQET